MREENMKRNWFEIKMTVMVTKKERNVNLKYASMRGEFNV